MSENYNMIYSLISLLILWVIIFWLYKEYCTDSYRQKVFALRDKLFDDAVATKLPFDHKSYGLLRITMNGSIRYAHKLNLGLLLLALFSTNNSEDELIFRNKFEHAIKDLSENQKSLVIDYRNKLMILTITHMLRSSPILSFTIIIPIILNILLLFFIKQITQILSVPLKKIITILYAAGDDTPEAYGMS
jgi:hypothetical protein